MRYRSPLRYDPWEVNRRELETTVQSIDRDAGDADMVYVRMANGEGIHCSKAYLRSPHEMKQLFEDHDLVVRVEPTHIVAMLMAVGGVDLRGWYRRKAVS